MNSNVKLPGRSFILLIHKRKYYIIKKWICQPNSGRFLKKLTPKCYYSRVVILFGKFIIFFIKWQFGGTDKVTNCYFSYSLSAVGSHFRKNRRTNLKNQRFFSKFVRAPNLWNKFVCIVFYIIESQYDFSII